MQRCIRPLSRVSMVVLFLDSYSSKLGIYVDVFSEVIRDQVQNMMPNFIV